MVRLAILDQDGKHLTLQDVSTAKELLTLVEQARSVMQVCERFNKWLPKVGPPSSIRFPIFRERNELCGRQSAWVCSKKI